MCYILLASVASLFSFTWIEVEVSYAEVSGTDYDLATGLREYLCRDGDWSRSSAETCSVLRLDRG
jgi:hypothetical protein